MILQDYRSMDEVDNIGGFLCVQKTLQIMLQREPRPMPAAGRPTGPSPRHMSRGSIVILTSFASEGAFLGVRNYISAKHAVKEPVQTAGKRVHNILPNDCEDRRTRQRIQLALENARKLIRINAVAPSYVSGPMINKYLEEVPALKTTMLRDLAIGRFVDPEEVADAVAFLTSASASYINGHTLTVDGGSSLHLANTPFRMNN